MKKSMEQIIAEFKANGGKVTVCKPSYGSRKRPKTKQATLLVSTNIGKRG